MKFTNKHNFPDYVVNWASTDFYDYNPETISATGVLKPIQAIILERKYHDKIEIDISDRFAAQYGTALHLSVERLTIANSIMEERMSWELGGMRVTGKPDLIINLDKPLADLIDVKSTSVWSYIYGSRKEDHKKQLSIYRYLAEMNDYKINPTAKIWYIFTDWSASKARQGGDYPPTRVVIDEIELYSNSETEALILKRIKELGRYANNTEDDALPKCSREELWQSDDTYAVMKKGGKRSLKNYGNEAEAKAHIIEKEVPGGYIDHREGKVVRCNYCNARAFCHQYKELKNKGLIQE